MIKIGDHGDQVKYLQKDLNHLHFLVGAEDGWFGPRTDSGVRRLQAAFGLTVDAVVGPETAPALHPAGKLSPHFSVFEFFNHGNGDLILKHKLIVELEKLRHAIGDRPIGVYSGYRDPVYNRKIGGVPYSFHLIGMAADIHSPGISVTSLSQAAASLFGGIGIYHRQGFVHVDVRGYRARW